MHGKTKTSLELPGIPPNAFAKKSRQTEDLIMNEVCVMYEIEVEKGIVRGRERS
jgi:hypothetical protein